MRQVIGLLEEKVRQEALEKEQAMWHADLALALAWFIPILLGALVGLVLIHFSDDKEKRAERRENAANAAVWHH